MSKKSLAEALKEMELKLTERLVSFTSDKVKELSEEIKEELTTEYNYFFQMIVDEVIGKTATPGLISKYTTWKPLSKKWISDKGTKKHYVGLSDSKTLSRALGRRVKEGRKKGLSRLRANGTKPSGRNKTGSFETYIQSLNTAGTTERFFGPVAISYDFVSPNPNISVVKEQTNGLVKQVAHWSKSRNKFVAFPKNLNMKATITAFGKLKGVKFDEWSVVDYIIKRVDPSNEKQWVKINSEYGIGMSNRPIRAVITPILRYYMDKRFSEIVKDAVNNRK